MLLVVKLNGGCKCTSILKVVIFYTWETNSFFAGFIESLGCFRFFPGKKNSHILLVITIIFCVDLVTNDNQGNFSKHTLNAFIANEVGFPYLYRKASSD